MSPGSVHERPGQGLGADSSDLRNTGSIDCCDELSEELGRGLPAEDLAGAVVEFGSDGILQTSVQTGNARVFYSGQRGHRMIFRSITPE